MASQGVSKSDKEIVQKSCPSGAPARAAAACNAEIPGDTSMAIREAASDNLPSASNSKFREKEIVWNEDCTQINCNEDLKIYF